MPWAASSAFKRMITIGYGYGHSVWLFSADSNVKLQQNIYIIYIIYYDTNARVVEFVLQYVDLNWDLQQGLFLLQSYQQGTYLSNWRSWVQIPIFFTQNEYIFVSFLLFLRTQSMS